MENPRRRALDGIRILDFTWGNSATRLNRL